MGICVGCWNKLFALHSANKFYVDDDFSLADDELLGIIVSGKCERCGKDSKKILGGAFDEISLDEKPKSSTVKRTSLRCLRQQEFDSLLRAIRVARLNLAANADTRSLIDDCYDDFGDHPNNQLEI